MNWKRQWIVIWIVFFGYLPPVAAESLSIDAAVAKAKNYSPDVRALKGQYESAQAKAALALAPTEPTFQVNWNDMTSAFHINNSASTVYQITQPILFPGKSWVNRAALKDAASAVGSQLQSMQLQVAGNVRAAYMTLLQAREILVLNQEQRRSYERILEIAKRRYETGAIPQVDLLNAQVTLYSNTNDVNDLEAAEKTALTQLNVLIGASANKPWEIDKFVVNKKHLLPTLAEAERKMLDNRNELKAARAQLSSAENAYTLAKLSVLPDFQLSAGMTHYNVVGASPLTTMDAGIATTYMFGVQMTVPLWFMFNERQTMSGASQDRAAARANLEVALNQSRVSLETTLDALKSLQLRLANYEEHLLPLSEQALTLALISYSTGKIDFQTLVDTANSRRNNRRDYMAALVNYVTNYSALGQLMGEEL